MGRAFGARLRALRARVRLSQSALARALETTPSTVRRWERGRGLPRLGDLERLAAALSVRPHELLLDETPQAAPVEVVRLAERLARERPDLAAPAAAMLRGLLRA